MIDVDIYITDLRKNIIFLDNLIEVRDYKKEDFLEKLDIQPRTFRRLKNSVTASTKGIIEKLNNQLNVNVVREDEVEKYNKIINEIIKNIYYKIFYDYNHYINLLNEIIAENNLLHPIFMLFKMILIMNNSRLSRDSVTRLIRDDFKYVSRFISFFEVDIKIIYDYCYIYCGDIDKIDVNEIITDINPTNNSITLILYLISGSYMIKKNYSMALIYAFECEKRFLITENYNRVNYVRNNICCYYNLLGQYNLAAAYAEKISILLELNLENVNLIQLFLSNYGLTLLMKKEYKKMRDIFSRKEILNLPNHIGKLYYMVLLYMQNEYVEILAFYSEFNFETKMINNYVKFINYLVNKVKKIKYHLNILNLSDTLKIIYNYIEKV